MGIKEQEDTKAGVFFVPERQQRLDLILHLIPNTRQTVLLRGPEQSGKSFFIQQFKEQANTNWRICSINNHDLMGESDPLQVFADALDDGESKKQIFSRLEAWDRAKKKVIFCVEDAHILDVVRFNFLFDLAENYNCVQLLLTSSENLGDEIESRCQLIDIEPLTQKQTSDYARMRLNKRGLAKSLDLAGIDELVLFIETGGLPGLINNTLEQINAASTVAVSKKKPLAKTQLKWGLLGLAGVLSLGLVFGLYQQTDEPPKSNAVAVEQQAVDKVLVVSREVEAPVEIKDKQVEVKLVAPIYIEEEKEIAVVEVSHKPQKTPKVNSSAVMQTPKKEVMVNELELVATKPAITKPATTKPATTKPATTKPATTKPATTKPSLQTQVQKNHNWIAGRKNDHYTLQLLGVSTEKSAYDYVVAKQELKSLLFFQNKRNSGAWYSVIYGDFVTQVAAEKAAKHLPKSLGRLKPWVRRFDAIQAEVFVKK